MRGAALLLVTAIAAAASIENVPTDSRLYDDLDLLKTSGFISLMPATSRPWTREQCVRMLLEAESAAATRSVGPLQRAALERLLFELGEDMPGRGPFRRSVLSLPVPERPGWSGRGEPFVRARVSRTEQAVSAGIVLTNRPGSDFCLYDRGELTAFRPAQYWVRDSAGDHLPGARVLAFHDHATLAAEHAYLAFRTPWLRIEAGRDEFHWGPGYRSSVMLSDNAPALDHLQLGAAFRSFKFLSFTAFLSRWNLKPRFLSAQRIEVSLWNRLTLGGALLGVASWEQIQPSQLGGIVNPLIPIYLSEANSGHNGNLLVGWDAEFYLPQTRIYAQLFLDNYEFNTRGVAPNCVGTQCGLYWVAPRLPVDVRAEYVAVTAFSYYHRLRSIMYENYLVPLGHEIGPDADRLWTRVRLSPAGPVAVALCADYTRRGYYNRGDYQRKSFWYESQHSHTPLATEFPSLGRDSTGAVIEQVEQSITVGPEVECWLFRYLRLVGSAAWVRTEHPGGALAGIETGIEFSLKAEYRY